MLGRAVAADRVGTLPDDVLPEEQSGRLEPRLDSQLVLPGDAYELGNLRVGVQSGQAVFAIRGRAEHGHVIEPLGQLEVFLLPGKRVEIGQGLVHPAMLGAQDTLQMLVVQAGVAIDCPVAELLAHIEGLLVVAVDVHIHQAGEYLVQGVVGDPCRFPGLQVVEEVLRKCAQVAVAKLFLALGQARHHCIALSLQPRVAGTGVHQCAGREVVAYEMPAPLEFGLFQSPQGLCRGKQPGRKAEITQQPLRVEREEILAIEVLGMSERTVQEPHVAEIEGRRLRGNHVGDVQLGDGEGQLRINSPRDGAMDANKTKATIETLRLCMVDGPLQC